MVGCAAPTLPTAHATQSSGHFGPLGPPGSGARREAVVPAAPHVPSGSGCSCVAHTDDGPSSPTLPMRALGSVFSGNFKSLHNKGELQQLCRPLEQGARPQQRVALYNHDRGALFQPPDLAPRWSHLLVLRPGRTTRGKNWNLDSGPETNTPFLSTRAVSGGGCNGPSLKEAQSGDHRA